METFWRREDILWGQGGDRPGVHIYDIDACKTSRIWSLPAGHSVYALDISPDGSRLAAGTKGGFLYHAYCSQQAEDYDEIQPSKITQGFAVLSICFLDPDTVAVSDIIGRCLLWHLEGSPHSIELSTGGSTVYSLFRLADGNLAGLTLEGRLLVWRWPAGRIVQELPIPLPPDHSALVKPIYWPAAGAWVWPGKQGIIVTCHMNTGEVATMRAHNGDVYAVSTCGGKLLTVGRDEGVLKIWNYGNTEPEQQCEAPLGVIASTAWVDPEPNIILANDHGAAGLYDVSSGTLRFIRGLQGRDFRVIVGPDQERLESAVKQRRTQQAHDIASEIRRKNLDNESADVEKLHDELIQLGYEHMSLALRAEEAKRNDDLVSELKYSKRVADLVSYKEPGARAFLLRYAALLESVWQLTAARDLCEQLLGLYPCDELLERTSRLEKYTKYLKTGVYVIASDISLRVLTQSAWIMGTVFSGRYAIGQHDPIHTGVSGLSPSALIEEYERLCTKYRGVPAPCAKEATVYWFSATHIEQVHMVLFDGADSSPVQGLEFGLKVHDAGLQTVLVPLALFNADSGSIAESSENNINGPLDELQSQTVSNGWLRAVEQLVSRAISAVVNQRRVQPTHFFGADNGAISSDNISRKETWSTRESLR